MGRKAANLGPEGQRMVLRNGGRLCAKGKASHTAAGCGRCILLCLLSSCLFLHRESPSSGEPSFSHSNMQSWPPLGHMNRA